MKRLTPVTTGLVLVFVLGLLAVGAGVAAQPGAQAGHPAKPFATPAPPPGPPDANPYTQEWLAANHGKYDNRWTALYEQQLQSERPWTAPWLDRLGLAPLIVDVRMSSPSFNSSQNEFQIVINPTDSAFALGSSNDSLTAGVGLYRTTDGGATWTAFDAPIGQAACCDPGVAYAFDGNAYVSVLDTSPSRALVMRSSDNGATWTAPVPVSLTDRENIIVDNGISSPRQGRVYITYSFAGTNQIGGYYSTNQGVTWSPTALIGGPAPAAGYQQSSEPYVASDGTLYVGYQEYENSGIGCNAPVRNWLSRSSDGGASFTRFMIGGTTIIQGGACPASQAGRGVFCIDGAGNSFRSRSHPIVSGDPSNPSVVYVVYSGGDLELPYTCAGANGFHSDTLFIKSTDGGATWGPKIKINGDAPGKDQYYPWLDVAANGMLWVGWHDRREDASNFQHRWYQAYSSDQGATWFEYPVADVMSHPSTFIGDYAGMAASNDLALGMWWDSRIKTGGDPYTEVTVPQIGTATPTPTGTPPTLTPTSTATPTPTSTATNTLTPTPTATAIPVYKVYLPLLLYNASGRR